MFDDGPRVSIVCTGANPEKYAHPDFVIAEMVRLGRYWTISEEFLTHPNALGANNIEQWLDGNDWVKITDRVGRDNLRVRFDFRCRRKISDKVVCGHRVPIAKPAPVERLFDLLDQLADAGLNQISLSALSGRVRPGS